MSDAAKKAAEIIMQDDEYIFTTWGRKSLAGLTSIVDQAADEKYGPLLDLIDAAGNDSPMNVADWIEFHWEPICEQARKLRKQP